MPKQDKETRRICFVIAPIGEEGSDIRRRSDQILNHVITPAAKDCGYETIRADRISEPGIITSQVIQHLVADPLVIADLTGRNPNVFYELAVRHAVRKPCVQIIQTGEPVPFDVAQTRTIVVDHRDLDSAARCREELVKQIHAAETDPTEVDSPISVAIDLQSLRQSENPQERGSAEIIEMLYDLRMRLDGLAGAVSSRSAPVDTGALGYCLLLTTDLQATLQRVATTKDIRLAIEQVATATSLVSELDGTLKSLMRDATGRVQTDKTIDRPGRGR